MFNQKFSGSLYWIWLGCSEFSSQQPLGAALWIWEESSVDKTPRFGLFLGSAFTEWRFSSSQSALLLRRLQVHQKLGGDKASTGTQTDQKDVPYHKICEMVKAQGKEVKAHGKEEEGRHLCLRYLSP